MANIKLFLVGSDPDLVEEPRRWERELGSFNLNSTQVVKMAEAIKSDVIAGRVLEIRSKNTEEDRWEIVYAVQGTKSPVTQMTIDHPFEVPVEAPPELPPTEELEGEQVPGPETIVLGPHPKTTKAHKYPEKKKKGKS